MDFLRIERAVKLAMSSHEGQKRKGSELPYVIHPYMVGLTLMHTGCPEDVVIAGILHDTVEDTEVSLKQIENEFGKNVALIVKGASEPEKKMTWYERKEHTIRYLQTAPKEVCMVTCADKLHNLRSMLVDYQRLGDDLWTRFKKGKEDQAWYYRSVLNSLKSKLEGHPLYRELEIEFHHLFSDIKIEIGQ